MTRQQARRLAFKAAKAAARVAAATQGLAALNDLRASRTGAIVQGPDLKTMVGRPYAKPHGQANWRVRDLDRLLDGSAVPAGCEATFHSTKGQRVVRTAAA